MFPCWTRKKVAKKKETTFQELFAPIQKLFRPIQKLRLINLRFRNFLPLIIQCRSTAYKCQAAGAFHWNPLPPLILQRHRKAWPQEHLIKTSPPPYIMPASSCSETAFQELFAPIQKLFRPIQKLRLIIFTDSETVSHQFRNYDSEPLAHRFRNYGSETFCLSSYSVVVRHTNAKLQEHFIGTPSPLSSCSVTEKHGLRNI